MKMFKPRTVHRKVVPLILLGGGIASPLLKTINPNRL